MRRTIGHINGRLKHLAENGTSRCRNSALANGQKRGLESDFHFVSFFGDTVDGTENGMARRLAEAASAVSFVESDIGE